MLYAYLCVQSETLTLPRMEGTLGRSDIPGDHPDAGIGGHSLGDPSPLSGRPLASSRWERAVVLPSDGLEGIDFEPRVAALRPDLADAVRALVEDGAWARLVVVQEVHASRPDNDDTGFVLERDALTWLARAGVVLDVDQYFFEFTWGQSARRAARRRLSDAYWWVWRLVRKPR